MVEEFLGYKLKFGTCAVYLLLRKGVVVYAGQSTNVFARLATHYQTMRRKQRGLHTYLNVSDPIKTEPIVFDEVRIKPCAKADLDREEIALIQTYMPKFNTLMKRAPVKVDLTMMPGFQHLLTKGRKEPKFKRRKLPPQQYVMPRTRGVTLPKLKCLEDAA